MIFGKSEEGSTGRLIELCAGYFFFYVLTGVSVKYFLSTAPGMPGMKDLEFLVYSTWGGAVIPLGAAVFLGWWRLKSNKMVRLGPMDLPSECLYIVPSGLCTAVVIPTTTLMYMLPISVMVAMVIMRASVIVISRAVDAIQIRQGILKKRVYWEEDAAVVLALGAAGTNLLWVGSGDFDFVHSGPAMLILGSYIAAYAFRIYIMNYFKNTRAPGVPLDNKGFFAIEQIAATSAMALATLLLCRAPSLFGASQSRALEVFRGAVAFSSPHWAGASLAGTAYGFVAFFSVFIFMFKGRTATFAGLVNRLTSLVAGTVSTLLFWGLFGGKFPKPGEWLSLGLIFAAVGFLTLAERKRSAEIGVRR